MDLESRKYLYDMDRAVRLLSDFSEDKTFQDYAEDIMLRSAIERQFEILGEALAQLSRNDLPKRSREIKELLSE